MLHFLSRKTCVENSNNAENGNSCIRGCWMINRSNSRGEHGKQKKHYCIIGRGVKMRKLLKAIVGLGSQL